MKKKKTIRILKKAWVILKTKYMEVKKERERLTMDKHHLQIKVSELERALYGRERCMEALIDISKQPCQNAYVIEGSCSKKFPHEPYKWCPSCHAHLALGKLT